MDPIQTKTRKFQSSIHTSTMLLLTTFILIFSSSSCSSQPIISSDTINAGGFESPRIKMAYYVIQSLRAKIRQDPSNDPKNITDTWVGHDVCRHYKGFRCAIIPTFNQKAVSDVQFNGYNLRAPLLGFLDKLVDVSIFHANSNRFHGVVPANLSPTHLPFLFELDLSNNLLEGSFPTTVLKATRLTFLDLRFNKFHGAVPPPAFALDVDAFFINNNRFGQRLPADLGSTPSMYLTFANNNFSGEIPGSIGKASKTLKEVLFLNNRLSGCLPWEIGKLKKATILDASKNKLSGRIPASFGCLKSVQILNLAENRLEGAVPEMLCQLPHLRRLNLRGNYLTGLGPECRKLIAGGGRKLDVRMNCIPGLPNQRSAGECGRFLLKPRPHCGGGSHLRLPCKGVSKRRVAVEVKRRSSSLTYGALRRR